MSVETTSRLRVAPPGFTKDQIRQFIECGFLVVQNAISPADVERYLKALDRARERYVDLTERDMRIYSPSLGAATSESKETFLHIEGLVGRDEDLEELIDHDRHIGFVYDIFGELTKLHISEAFVRPDSNGRNPWHVDGPRMVPFSTFSGDLPLQIRVGYWLTDLPEVSMGNLVVLPGSHRRAYFAHADTTITLPEEHVLRVHSGDMTIMHGSLWHKVDENLSDSVRKNIYIGYCPSWVMPGDQIERDDGWFDSLPRERRIILRHYEHPYDYSKPPKEDSPLFRERPEDPYPWRFEYSDDLSFHRRKQPTFIERFVENEVLLSAPAQ